MMCSELCNPYLYETPVIDRVLFAGRTKELDRVMKKINDAIELCNVNCNFLIMGREKAGKTSFLNALKGNIEEKGSFHPVIIPLNPQVSENLTVFQYYIFDEIFNSVYGIYKKSDDGKTIYKDDKKMYQYLLSITSNVLYNDLKEGSYEEFPYIFPVLYPNIINKESDYKILYSVYIRDLITLKNEVRKPIILFFDNCELIRNNKEILNFILYSFLDLKEFVCIFSINSENIDENTERNLEPFEKIRKKLTEIELDNFSKEEMMECLYRPFEKMEKNPSKLLKFSDKEKEELFELTQGNPYQIKLVANHMFKYYLENNDLSSIKLNVTILRSINRFFEAKKDKEIIDQIRELNHDEKYLLNLIINLREPVSSCLLKDLVQLDEESRINFDKCLNVLCNKKIIIKDKNKDQIIFSGNNNTFLYLKYNPTLIEFKELSNKKIHLDEHIALICENFLKKKLSRDHILGNIYCYSSKKRFNLTSFLSNFEEKSELLEYDNSFIGVFTLYKLLYENNLFDREEAIIYDVEIKICNSNPSYEYIIMVFFIAKIYIENKSDKKLIEKKLNDELKRIAKENNLNIDIDRYDGKIPSREIFCQKLFSIEKLDFKKKISDYHFENSFSYYKKNIEKAIENAELAVNLNSSANNLNTLGYLYMMKYYLKIDSNNYLIYCDKATEKFESGLKDDKSEIYTKMLIYYNMGCLYCINKHFEKAKKCFENSKNAGEKDSNGAKYESAIWLNEIELIDNSEIKLKEKQFKSIYYASLEALEIIDHFL